MLGNPRIAQRSRLAPLLRITAALCIVWFTIDRIALAQESYLFVTETGTSKVLRATLDGQTVEPILEGVRLPRRPSDVVVDVHRQWVYWRNPQEDSIQRCPFDGSLVENVIEGIGSGNHGIAIDPFQRKIYYAANSRLWRANLDGSNQEVVRNENVSHLAIDAKDRTIYYNIHNSRTVRRCNLDGSDAETVLTTSPGGPGDIALDPLRDVLYWTEPGQNSIRRLDLNHLVIEDIFRFTPGVRRLDVDPGGTLYYTVNEELRRANLDGSNPRTIHNEFIEDLALDNIRGRVYTTRFPTILRSIDTEGDDPVDLWSTVVDRPNGRVAVDPAAGKIYIGDSSGLLRANLDRTRVQRLYPGVGGRHVVRDPLSNQVYWDGSIYKTFTVRQIFSGTIGGSEPTLLFEEVGVESMDVDAQTGKVYLSTVSDTFQSAVVRMNPDGSDLEVPYRTSSPDFLTGIAIAPDSGDIFLGRGNFDDGSYALLRTDATFGSFDEIATGSYPQGLAVDAEADKVYWCEPGHGRVVRANFDGSDREIVLTGLNNPNALAVVNGFLPPEELCRLGNVNVDAGPLVDLLLVNGQVGDSLRQVWVAEGEALACEMLAPPTGSGHKYLVHANLAAPTPTTHTPLPFQVGSFCFPLIVSQGATPGAVWNALGKSSALGSSRYFDGSPATNPDPAPSTFLDLPDGDTTHLPIGTTVTLQGIIQDPTSLGPKRVSVTNAVVIQVN